MEIGKSECRRPDRNKDLVSVPCFFQCRTEISLIILKFFLKHRYFLHLCMCVCVYIYIHI